MRYRLDPKSGNELSILGFGCMRFPTNAVGMIDYAATEKLIVDALDAGVNYFDTAYLYPGSEDVLGKIMAAHGIRDRMLLATKLPHASCRKREHFDKYLDISLKRLQTDHIDYYLVHNVTSFAQWEGLCQMGIREWVAEQKASGRIGQFGFSFHGSASEFKRYIDDYDWDFCQIQYNYANEHHQAGVTSLHYAGERGIPVIIMEPLLGGKLAANLPKRAQQIFADESGLEPVAASVDAALRWLWNQPEVTVVLSGMNADEQLAGNIATANASDAGMLGPDDLAVYEQVLGIFQESFRIPCTGCNYCMPCPAGINIPAMFAAYNQSYSVSWFQGVWSYFMSAGAIGHDPHYATACIECGKCMRHCPQEIRIPDQLKKVRRRLQPPGGDAIMRTVSKIRM